MNQLSYFRELNGVFEGLDEINCENNVGEILKEIYIKWFYYETNFNNPITKVVCRKIDNILPKDDGGGLVQFKFY